ncbi:hypothetical protein [Hyalangium gracile]|uniref:hypothetical protein n=1 Tax=Hyalangium gracile TaxID=394092 RepID=UPI001CCE4FF3|nr:hypothetical protein [Hyalangium gracile]
MKPCASRPIPEEPEVLEELEPFMPEKGQSGAIIGVSQNGKSHLAMLWMAALLAMGFDVVGWDPCWQLGRLNKRREGQEPGPLEHTVIAGDLDADHFRVKQLSLAVRPADIYADRDVIAREFVQFAQLCIRALTAVGRPRRVALFVDECHLLVDHGPAVRLLEDMAERWGKEGVVPFFVTQRWSHLSVNVRAEVAWLISFLQTKRSDLQNLGLDAGKDFARAVARLKPREYRATCLRVTNKDALALLD